MTTASNEIISNYKGVCNNGIPYTPITSESSTVTSAKSQTKKEKRDQNESKLKADLAFKNDIIKSLSQVQPTGKLNYYF